MLTEEQKQFYADNGYVVVRGLLTPEEAAAYRQETHDLAERLSAIRNINSTWGSASTVTDKPTSLLHCHDVQFQSAAFSRLLVDERLTGAAADIIGPNVQLHHTKMFIKPPEKGSPFPMHQDAPFFPHDNHSMIAAIIHLTMRRWKKAASGSSPARINSECCRTIPTGCLASVAGRVSCRRSGSHRSQSRGRALFQLPDHSRVGHQCQQ